MSSGLDLSQISRVLISLVVVVIIMVLAMKFMRARGVHMSGRKLGTRRTAAAPANACIELVGRKGLSRSSSVALVRVGERYMVIGVTDSAVTMLGEGELTALGAAGEVAAAGQGGTAVHREAWTTQESEASGTLPPRGEGPGSAWTALLDAIRERTVRRI